MSHNLETVQDNRKRKSHYGLSIDTKLVDLEWPWTAVMAIILRYFAELGSFHGQLRKSGWLAVDLLIVSR